MIESDYTRAIHDRLPASVYHWKINDNFAGGVPDAFYRSLAGPGTPLWVEYKFIKSLPKRSTTLVVPDLTEQQKLWLKNARSAGEQVAVVLGVDTVKVNKQRGGIFLTLDEALQGLPTSVVLQRLESYNGIAQRIVNTVITNKTPK